jgi:hypothetical protein
LCGGGGGAITDPWCGTYGAALDREGRVWAVEWPRGHGEGRPASTLSWVPGSWAGWTVVRAGRHRWSARGAAADNIGGRPGVGRGRPSRAGQRPAASGWRARWRRAMAAVEGTAAARRATGSAGRGQWRRFAVRGGRRRRRRAVVCGVGLGEISGAWCDRSGALSGPAGHGSSENTDISNDPINFGGPMGKTAESKYFRRPNEKKREK